MDQQLKNVLLLQQVSSEFWYFQCQWRYSSAWETTHVRILATIFLDTKRVFKYSSQLVFHMKIV